MSRTVRREPTRSYYSRENAIARRAHNRSFRNQAAQVLRAMVKDTDMADEISLPAYRGTEGWLTH